MRKASLTIIFAVSWVSLTLGQTDARNPERKSVVSNLIPLSLEELDSTHAYDIGFYGLDLLLPMTSQSFRAHERVTVASRIAGLDSVTLHMRQLVCDSVKIGSSQVSFSSPTGFLTIKLDRPYDPGESLDIDIFYHRGSGQQRGLYWYPRYQTGYHVLAYTTTEPADARYWFPCFDEPWDKAEAGCAISITLPDSLSACANGLLDSATHDSVSHTSTYWWRHRYPIATYLMNFAASKWLDFRQWYHISPNESGFVWNFVWPEDSSSAVRSFANTPNMVEFFSDSNRYGRYPFEKYGMVEVYPFQWGGMEHQTMTTVNNYWVVNGSEIGISHELSHQWWGDMVTCLDWRNIWLNEGFATYSDALYHCYRHGRSAFVSLMQERASDYYEEEAEDLHPIYDPPFPDHLFDWGHSYCKGSWVQHMLRYVLGDTVWERPGTFFQALRAYGDSFRYRAANTEDYRRILEQVTGRDLRCFFDEWVYQAGYPQYQIGWHAVPDSSGYQLRLDIAQSNGPQAPDCFHIPLELSVRLPSKETLVVVPIDSNPQRYAIALSASPLSVSADPNSWVLQRSSVQVGVRETNLGRQVASLSVTPTLVRRDANIRFVAPEPCQAELVIYDAVGRQARRLLSGYVRRGENSLTWDLRDDAGQRVVPGVYFCRLDCARCGTVCRLTVE
ncbi:MAG: M1 family aminopeptidase [candidate division WOR-3 bacterium]